MVWGAIAYNKKGPLIFMSKDRRKAVDYVDLVLSKPLWDFYSILLEERGIVKVMEDGAPVHTCQVAKDFRNSHFLDIFPHPAQSPDMNPIEHVWYLIKIAINKRPRRPGNIEELTGALMEEWEKIDIKVINSLINSMPNRVRQLKEVNGGSTKY